jgi:hypothetical protein
MTSSKGPGFFRRLLAALASALRRGILGKSMARFTGSDAYWDRGIAAQRGWPQKQFPEPDVDGFRITSHAVRPARQSVRDTTSRPPEPACEPVRGGFRS